MKTLYLIGWWLLAALVSGPPAQAQAPAQAPAPAPAPSCDETVTLPEAAKRYANGNFDDVFALLGPCVQAGFGNTGKVQAYRLLALSYLAIDSLGQSQRAIGHLLSLSPQAEPDYTDPPRYKALFQYVRATQEQVMQVTSVSKKAENILYAPATVAVVTSRDFQQRGYQTLEQALHDLAGFDVIRGSGVVYSLFYQRGYRSDNNDRTLILVDGVEDNDLVSNQVVMAPQYALSDIDRIEVIYGPASTLYGANAFTGVINIITKSFRTRPGAARMLGLTAQTRAGTYGTQYIDGTLSARTPDVALTLTARTYRSAGRDLSEYPEWNYGARTAADYTGLLDLTGPAAQAYIATNALPASPYYNVVRNGANSSVTLTPQGAADAARQDNTLFGSSVQGSPVGFDGDKRDWYVRGKLEFKDLTISYFDWQTSESIVPWYTNRTVVPAGGNPRWITHDRAFSLTYTKQFGEKFSILNLSSYLLHEIDGETALVTYRGFYNRTLSFTDLGAATTRVQQVVTYQYRISTQFRNELRWFYSPLEKLDLNGGLEARSGLIQGNYITSTTGFADETGAVATGTTVPGGNNFRTLDLNTYAQANYRPTAALKLVAGARLDHNQVRDNGGYGTVINPRLAAIYHLGGFVFKGIYAEAFKDASFLQKYGTTTTRKLPNPTLQPERVRNYEGSIYYQVTKELSANLVGYYSKYNNSVGLDTVRFTDGTLTQQFQPVGSRRVWGLQAEGSLHLLHFNLWWNATYTNPIDAKTRLRISDIASYMANAGADYQVGHFSLYASGNLVGARRSGAGTSGGSNNPITRFDPYLVLNTNLSYRDLLPGLLLQVSVSNLLDTEYFVPGVRAADVTSFAARLPQDQRFISVGIYYTLPTASIVR